MGATVVLVGYSTAGKSRVAAELDDRSVLIRDSDKFVASLGDGDVEHIYQLFLAEGREVALGLVDVREREFLRSLTSTDRPTLVVAGPALPSREPEWSEFVARCSPTFLYFEQSAESVLAGLRHRRIVHIDEVGEATPGFGSWDEDVTTELTEDGTWRVVEEDAAIANIERHMASLVKLYEQLAGDNRVQGGSSLREGNNCQAAVERVRKLLYQSPRAHDYEG